MKKETSLNDNPAYRSFVQARDKELQVFHNKTQQIISDLLRGVFSDILLQVQASYSRLVGDNPPPFVSQIISDLDQALATRFKSIAPEICRLVMKMRQSSYIMANAGEVEAMGRAIGKEQTAEIGQAQVRDEEERPSSAGGQLNSRIEFYFDRLRRKIIDAVQMGAVAQDTQRDFMNRVYRVIPIQKAYKRPTKILKNVKEADRYKAEQIKSRKFKEQINFGQGRGRGTPVSGVSMTVGTIDESLWEGMVDDYITDYIPVNRGPEAVVDIDAIPAATRNIAGKIPPVSTDVWYQWELERDITQEFVDSVRKGQIDAANNNNINDFEWIAIIDSDTDECCIWRDGLTTSEIAKRLKTDKKDDPCKATVVPAHFKCRCTMAAVTKDIPKKPDVDLGDFEAWLVNPEI